MRDAFVFVLAIIVWAGALYTTGIVSKTDARINKQTYDIQDMRIIDANLLLDINRLEKEVKFLKDKIDQIPR